VIISQACGLELSKGSKGQTMNGTTSPLPPRVFILLCALTVPMGLAAHDLAAPISAAATAELGSRGLHHHHRYRLIDTGTLGGPTSSLGHEGERDLNNRGVLVSLADLAVPDPNAPNCITGDCFVGHTVEWRNGVLTDLSALPPNTDSSGPLWISDSGFVSGFSENGLIDPLTGFPEVRAIVWQEGSVINLGTFGGNNSIAASVNNRGQVVGGAATQLVDPFPSSFFLPFGAQQSRAFLWQNGSKEDLGTLGGPDAIAVFINDRGQVAGLSYIDSNVNPTTGTPTVHPFLRENGEMKDLGTIGGTLVFQLNHLNGSGELVGGMTTAGDTMIHPFLWDGKKLRDLGTLGGSFGNAIWVNDAGTVVGLASNASEDLHAFVWKHRVMIDLGVAAGDQCSIANAINASGQIVGSSGDCSAIATNALLWDRGELINLNAFVPTESGVQLTEAVNINNRGDLAVQGVLPNGDLHAFLLTPCDDDEPVEAADCSDGQDGRGGIAVPRGPRPTVNARGLWRPRMDVGGATPAVIRQFLDVRSGRSE
jgi:probable HAF family extracellular repeat protein